MDTKQNGGTHYDRHTLETARLYSLRQRTGLTLSLDTSKAKSLADIKAVYGDK